MLDAYWTIDQIIKRIKKIGWTSVTLTDHGSVSGHIQLIRKCKEAWLKPIPGCEMYVVDDLEKMKLARDMVPSKKADEQETDEYQAFKQDIKSKARRKMHFNVLPKNQKWLLAIWDLVTTSWTEWMYFKPSIDWKLLEKHKENLWLWTACESWPLWRVLQKAKFDWTKLIEEVKYELEENIEQIEKEISELDPKIDNTIIKKEFNEKITILKNTSEIKIKQLTIEWKKIAEKELRIKLIELKNLFWDNLYVEIIPIPDERANWIYLLSYKIAKELNILTIATNDSHYPEKEDSKYQDVLYCTNMRRSNSSIMYTDSDRKRYTPWLFYIHSPIEMFDKMVSVFPTIPEKDIYDMINNSQIIVDWTELVVEPKVPAVAYRWIFDIDWEKWTNLYRQLSQLIASGWKFRWFDKADAKTQEIYRKRIIREVWVISNKWYIDYFLIMRDIMNWCDTDRPFIENFDKWFEFNGEHFYKGKTKEEVYTLITKTTNLLKPKKPIATWIARGSAWGSLVTYLLQITNINPIPGKLLFERFLDYTRGDVYYKMNFDNYSKPQFLKDFPEENKERLNNLELKYDELIDKSFNSMLLKNEWYHHLQLTREKWLLNHNQAFSREKEYFYTILDKIVKGEIKPSNNNTENSILAWTTWITNKEPKWDFIVNLTDIPDIDADFEDARRDEVYLYLIHRYWIHNSCRISTYNEIKDKSGLDMLTRIFWKKDIKDPKLEKTDIWILKDIKDIKDAIEEYKRINDIKSTAAIKQKDVKYFLDLYKRNLDWEIIKPLELNLDENWKVIVWNEYWIKEQVDKYPWIVEFWEPMFWQIIWIWQHAAWMIVHNKPIVQYWAMYSNKDKKTWEMIPVIAWDKNESESMGLMKLDILGLNTCANLREVNELVEKRKWYKHHWQRIENVFEDEKTIELMNTGRVAWLFQLEGWTMLWLTKHIQPNNLEDVVMINAWGRPGPLEYIHSLKYKEKKNIMMKAKKIGLKEIKFELKEIFENDSDEVKKYKTRENEAIKIKNKKEKEIYREKLMKLARKLPLEKNGKHEDYVPFYFKNEIYEEITKERYWLIIYQEDIMAISKRMCLYDDKMVWKIRKMVWKATYGWLDDLEEDFIWRLVKHSEMDPILAKNLWDYIKWFWTYCFNKAHAEAYAMLAWIQGFYKANYPLEFYAWTLKTLPDKSEDKVNLLLKDYKDHWYKLLPPDINLSAINFEINKDTDTLKEFIRVWLLYIKGLWIKQAEEIIRKQPYEWYKDFIKRIDKRVVNAWVRQITKDIWLFNNIWGAPLIEEKLVPAIEFIEFIWDFKNIFEDLLNNYSYEKLIWLFSLFWVKEEKLPLDEKEKNLSLDNYKKIITKIKSKINSFSNWIIKGVINKSEVAIDIKYSEILINKKEEIDEMNKEVLKNLKDELKEIKSKMGDIEKLLLSNNLNLGKIQNDYAKINKIKWRKENIVKKIKEGITLEEKQLIKTINWNFDLDNTIVTKDNIKEVVWKLIKIVWDEVELNIKNSIIEMKKNEIEYKKYLLLKKTLIEKKEELSVKIKNLYDLKLKNVFSSLIKIEKDIIKDLWIDKGLYKIKIDNEKAIKHCPILLNVDLSKYRALWKNFKAWTYYTLKQIDAKNEIKFWLTVWMIREISIWQEREKPTQGRVQLELMIWEKISKLFINWEVYEKNKELFDNLKIADIIVVSFKKTLRFPVIAVENIFDLPTLYNRVVNYDLTDWPLTFEELKILK